MGGIEKFNRSFLKSLSDYTRITDNQLQVISVYDSKPDDAYFPINGFNGYSGNKFRSMLGFLARIFTTNICILGHINLFYFGLIYKLIRPKSKLILIAHGIEVWKPLSFWARLTLKKADAIFCVSQFTIDQILKFNPDLIRDKLFLFHNTIDPFFPLPTGFSKTQILLDRYNIPPRSKVLLTLTRLSSDEQYKGYDNVLAALVQLKQEGIDCTYLICGKADEIEKKRVENMIDKYGLLNQVKLLGFIRDEELIDHYLLCDCFVMPSRNEGFGIVFIEAMACGRRVIAGNLDGSRDALLGGRLGTLVNPNNISELASAIKKNLYYTEQFDPKALQTEVVFNFGFDKFSSKLRELLNKI
jgi:glycosyltransferase involved in cell wall biosynthesis